jgi:hypothetical protein
MVLQLDKAWRLKMCDKADLPEVAGSDVGGNRVYDVATVAQLVAAAINVNPNALGMAKIDATGNLLFKTDILVDAATLRLAIQNLADRDISGAARLTASRAAATTQYIVTCICKCKLRQCDTIALADDIKKGVTQLLDGNPDGTMANHIEALVAANSDLACVRFTSIEHKDTLCAIKMPKAAGPKVSNLNLFLYRYRQHMIDASGCRVLMQNYDHHINNCACILITIFMHYAFARAITGEGSDEELIDLLRTFEPPDIPVHKITDNKKTPPPPPTQKTSAATQTQFGDYSVQTKPPSAVKTTDAATSPNPPPLNPHSSTQTNTRSNKNSSTQTNAKPTGSNSSSNSGDSDSGSNSGSKSGSNSNSNSNSGDSDSDSDSVVSIISSMASSTSPPIVLKREENMEQTIPHGAPIISARRHNIMPRQMMTAYDSDYSRLLCQGGIVSWNNAAIVVQQFVLSKGKNQLAKACAMKYINGALKRNIELNMNQTSSLLSYSIPVVKRIVEYLRDLNEDRRTMKQLFDTFYGEVPNTERRERLWLLFEAVLDRTWPQWAPIPRN